MANPYKDLDIGIAVVKDKPDYFGLQQGPETFEVSRDELKAIVNGLVDKRTLLLWNYGISLVLSGKDSTATIAELDAVAKSKKYKGPE